MRIVTYLCEECFEPHEFKAEDKRDGYFCPKCGKKLMYWSTDEIDPITKKVIEHYDEEDRRKQNPGEPISPEFSFLTRPAITCPYCHSTDTRKLPEKSVFMADNLFWGSKVSEVGKNFHCNKCGADF